MKGCTTALLMSARSFPRVFKRHPVPCSQTARRECIDTIHVQLEVEANELTVAADDLVQMVDQVTKLVDGQHPPNMLADAPPEDDQLQTVIPAAEAVKIPTARGAMQCWPTPWAAHGLCSNIV